MAATTFVTAFLNLREDRSKDKSPERCFQLFAILAATGVPIHAFVDPEYIPQLPPLPTTVRIEPLALEDLATYAVVAEAKANSQISIPVTGTPHHDTVNFHTLMNAKTELVCRVAATVTTPQVAWVDFSIFHVLRDKEPAIHQLRHLAATRFRPGVYLPGCWDRGTAAISLETAVNWRFCGGFFLGDIASLQEFHAKASGQLRQLLDRRHPRLVWEVNVWHLTELSTGWSPVWFRGDHNNSILNIPSQYIHVVAALTTIPPRVNTSTRAAIDSVLSQVSHVYLCLPSSYRRFGAYPMSDWPAWLQDEPYASKVTVISGEDYGPATKYIGPANSPSVPVGAWVLTIDDDQEYVPDIVQKMLGAVKPGAPLAAYQNHYTPILTKTSGGIIHGYVGNLIPNALTRGLAAFPLPEEARFVDDQWMSIFCFRRGIRILPTPLEHYPQIFKVLQNGHEKLAEHSLSGLGTRDEKVRGLEAAMGVRFLPDARWQIVPAAGEN